MGFFGDLNKMVDGIEGNIDSKLAGDIAAKFAPGSKPSPGEIERAVRDHLKSMGSNPPQAKVDSLTAKVVGLLK